MKAVVQFMGDTLYAVQCEDGALVTTSNPAEATEYATEQEAREVVAHIEAMMCRLP